MKPWSLGRLDFQLPNTFNLSGRQQSIYHVDIKTITPSQVPINDMWEQRLQEIKKENIARGHAKELVHLFELAPGAPGAIYPRSRLMNDMEVYMLVDQHILKLKYSGAKDKQENMKRLLSIVAQGYRVAIPNGFNVGLGSIVSKPSRYERASASFTDEETQCTLTLSEATVVGNTNEGPMTNISEEIAIFNTDGFSMKILKDENHTAAGISGQLGLVSAKESNASEREYRYTWFYEGKKQNSFEPEILLKMLCPEKHEQRASKIWSNLLATLKIRPE